MTELVAACPLCGSSANAPFDQRTFHDHPVTNVICQRCGLVYQSPRMTESENQAFYEAEYRLLYQGQEGPNPKDLKVQAARAQAALEFTSQHVKSTNRILDIGCSTGILLKKFQAHYQCRASGVEPGNLYRQYAQSLGLEVFASLDELPRPELPHFSLVSILHVLEHIPNPVAYLQDLREKFLDPGGWLLLEVPNLYAHDCFEIAHLVSFSTHSLSQVVRKAGFQVIQLHQHGLPRSRLIPLYLTLIAQPDSSISYSLQPDRKVSLQRQIGFFRRRLAERLFPRRAWIPMNEI